MNVNLHTIKNVEFSVKMQETSCTVPILTITVGEAEVNIFFHDGKWEQALADIDTAIRSYVIEGDNL